MRGNVQFVTWQPVLTDHQAFTMQELATQSATEIVAYVMRPEDSVRRAQGWTPTQVASIEQRLIPANRALRHCMARLREHRAATHFFCSPFESPLLILTLLWAAATGIDFYLISEPYSPRSEGYLQDTGQVAGRLKAWLRPIAYFIYGASIRRRASGVFAISRLAVRQYRRVGLKPCQLFPFGYFIPRTDDLPTESVVRQGSAPLRIVFVGSLIRRKGIDLLVTAVSGLLAEGHDITLDIFGPGDPATLAVDASRIRYRGAIPFGSVQSVVAGYDLLVLPSRFDGWGVVVNEALLARVPVLCSDQVGARVVVETFGAGSVFVAGDAPAISLAIEGLLDDPERLAAMQRSTERAALAIEPSVAAAYMLTVLRSEPESRASIPSPWYAAQGHAS